MNTRELTKPIYRRIGRLMVTVTAEGVQLRGYRCRRRFRLITWEEIASLASVDQPVIRAVEQALGADALLRAKAHPSMETKR